MEKFIYLFAIVAMGLSSCSKDAATITIDSSKPDGAFTVMKSGMFVAENKTPTAGTAELGKDSKGVQFLHFTSNFTTEFGTGTVTVYLSTSAVFDQTATGTPSSNLKSVGVASKAGEVYYKIDPSADPKFTHVIVWCGTAKVPFGNAPLK